MKDLNFKSYIVMKKIFTIFTLLMVALAVQAQTPADTVAPEPSPWTKKASLGINFTNVGLVNWAGGGENSFSVSSIFAAQAQYKKDKVTWLNSFEAGYGLVRQGNSKFIKSDDRIVAISKFSRALGNKNFAYSALLDFRTQMDKGFAYGVDDSTGKPTETPISNFFAPAYLTISTGIEYKPSDNFYFMISPVAGKATFVLDETLSNQGAYGVDTGSTIRPEFGGVVSMRYSVEVMKNVSYETKVNLFQSYKKGAYVDIMWDNIITLKVNDFLTTTFTTQLVYDEDVEIQKDNGEVGPAVQFKHVLAVGFLVKLVK